MSDCPAAGSSCRNQAQDRAGVAAAELDASRITVEANGSEKPKLTIDGRVADCLEVHQ
jgi:hypothetical protein